MADHKTVIDEYTFQTLAVGCFPASNATRNAFIAGMEYRQKEIDSLIADLSKAIEAQERFKADTERLNTLRDLMGYVQDGSHDTVNLEQDDATYEFFVSVGKLNYHGRSFRDAIDAAMKIKVP